MKNLLIYGLCFFFFLGSGCSKDELRTNGKSNSKSGSITRFAAYQDYLYVLDQNKILTYYAPTADTLILENTIVDEYGLETITIYNGTIYIGSRNALYILNISNPAKPYIQSKTSRETSLLGGCDPVALKGNYAYSTVKIIENRCGRTSSTSQLLVYDVTDNNNTILENSLDMDAPNGLATANNYLLVCDEGADKILIFDITQPTQLLHFSEISLQDPVDLIVDGSQLFVSTNTGFSIFNIADMSDITLAGTINK